MAHQQRSAIRASSLQIGMAPSQCVIILQDLGLIYSRKRMLRVVDQVPEYNGPLNNQGTRYPTRQTGTVRVPQKRRGMQLLPQLNDRSSLTLAQQQG